ncbi:MULTISPECIES: cytochrome b/b6 domain-containing protein [unclassified Agarivorans]|uniref:cytochrome b/b6 domain-containing protein n=1 Tax=unclassified Agarivorans TaxID=2636026 RepID=UPI0026E211CE|nr:MULTISPECIES: cytochrome b/b6 domain-containing protein [unclassified Agarivorans]MDO6684081.1 cytochrome b/b6 domain-containing protein [Agarivorans sp. 3_MG-2023]MDO6714185.1 cytochrome b/b6 domain-containing protein [Agarivorans sp. 2_MG-2023]
MKRTLVWDGFVRFYHWLQLLLLAGLWLSMEQAEVDIHIKLGLTLFVLLLVRLVWGLVGSETALFKSLQLHPKGVVREIKQELKGEASNHNGHSFLGSYMVLALWLLLLIQLVSGLFNSDDILSEGPLYAYVNEQHYEWFKSLHASNVNYLLGLIAIHILAIGYFSLIKRGYLHAMINGYKTAQTIGKPMMKKAIWPILTSCLLIGVLLVFIE